MGGRGRRGPALSFAGAGWARRRFALCGGGGFPVLAFGPAGYAVGMARQQATTQAAMPSDAEIVQAEGAEECARRLRLWQLAQQYHQHNPALYIQPHNRGQVQALESDHTYRILIPGNGFGKTTCMGLDADMLMQRLDPFKPHIIPNRPTTAIWFCQKFQQFEILRPQLENDVFTAGWQYRINDHYYQWPNGSRLFLLSADSNWTAIQGIEIDAVYFDEHPGRSFWNEMLFRRRGKHKARYMVAATMTQGMTWFVREVIQPWEAWQREQGRSDEDARFHQDHATTFVWNRGGIEDNPAMGGDDVEHYQSITTVSEKESLVRVGGGYADFTGEAVFNLDALHRMEQVWKTDGENGNIVFVPDQDERVMERLIQARRGEQVSHRFAGIRDPSLFEWVPEMPVDRGRITLYEHPEPDTDYVIGADFAAGLLGKDYDAAMVGRIEDGRVVQVAEALGHWGDVFFAEILYKLGVFYNEAFIVGERQFGLPALRRLYDEMLYQFLYRRRQQERPDDRRSDHLGHHRGIGDMVVANHRLAVRQEEAVLRSGDAIEQHKRYQFRPRAETKTMDDVSHSGELITSAPEGEFDDLVMAGVYMTHAAREVPWFERPPKPYAPGTFGQTFEVDKILKGEHRKRKDPYSR